jgi:hypothetical protein
MCNGAPFATGNWTNFWEVSAPGSELQVVMNAGHLQFADVSGAWNGVCCTGCVGLLSQEVSKQVAGEGGKWCSGLTYCQLYRPLPTAMCSTPLVVHRIQ